MISTIIIFLIILSVLVIAHEAGHYLTAKYFGVQVEEFGLGFPPRAKTLFTTNDGVKWTLNWLPFGGFVKLKGENGGLSGEPNSFGHKAPWKRIVVLSAGVAMNFILAFVLLSIGFAVGWPQDLTDAKIAEKNIKEKQIMIVYVEPGSPAENADLKRGDAIQSVDSVSYSDLPALQTFIEEHNGEDMEIEILRDKTTFTKYISPQKIKFHLNEDKNGETVEKIGIGVGLGVFGVVRYPITEAVSIGARNTVVFTGKIINAFYGLIRDIIFKRSVSQNIGGPVMIAAITNRAAQLGFIYLIQLVALLSLNLAIINILPIPALDGGRILFVIIEKLKGGAVSASIETWFHMIGFWLLIALTALITARDVIRLDVWEKIKQIIVS